jgi:prephenate dehydrogenase
MGLASAVKRHPVAWLEDASNHCARSGGDGSTAAQRIGGPAAILAGMRIGLLGLGLIGGSVARALRDSSASEPAEPWSVAAWTPTGRGLVAALEDGVIDQVAASPEEAIAGADLVILAGPALDSLAQLDELAGPWRQDLAPDAVITDVASTKEAIVLRATALGLRFVGGHPMAGSDTSGYEASSADLFADRPWVVVPTSDVVAVERVERLAMACRALPVRLGAAEHDRAVAGISHLPLVVAAALVEAVAGDGTAGPSVDWPTAANLAATGWRDTTRLARGDATMGASIVATNAPALAARVRDLMTALEGWLAELERPGGPDVEEIADRLRSARKRLEATLK